MGVQRKPRQIQNYSLIPLEGVFRGNQWAVIDFRVVENEDYLENFKKSFDNCDNIKKLESEKGIEVYGLRPSGGLDPRVLGLRRDEIPGLEAEEINKLKFNDKPPSFIFFEIYVPKHEDIGKYVNRIKLVKGEPKKQRSKNRTLIKDQKFTKKLEKKYQIGR